MRLGIDIDDVLFPWSTLAHKACEAAGITNGKTITQWAFHKDYGCTSEELWEVLHAAYRDGMLLNSAPTRKAALALCRLRSAGHSVHLVTARGFEGPLASLVRQHTVEWLREWYIEHDSLTFAKDKTVMRLDVAIDDGVKNVVALESAGVPTYLVDTIHNQEFEHPRRVLSINEFADAILGQEDAA